jgi:hypothetical protein
MLRGDARDGTSQLRLESFAASKRGDADIFEPKALSPAAGFVQATDGHGQLGSKPSHQLDDKPFGSARIEAQDHLKNLGGPVCRFTH